MRKDYKSERDRCFSDPQRREKRQNEDWEKLNLKGNLKRRAGRKGNFNSQRQIQIPSMFQPREKTRREYLASVRATLAFHTDRESKWATTTSPPSPLIRCLFLPLFIHRGRLRRNRSGKKRSWNDLFFSARGVWIVFSETERQPWLFNYKLIKNLRVLVL